MNEDEPSLINGRSNLNLDCNREIISSVLGYNNVSLLSFNFIREFRFVISAIS